MVDRMDLKNLNFNHRFLPPITNLNQNFIIKIKIISARILD